MLLKVLQLHIYRNLTKFADTKATRPGKRSLMHSKFGHVVEVFSELLALECLKAHI